MKKLRRIGETLEVNMYNIDDEMGRACVWISQNAILICFENTLKGWTGKQMLLNGKWVEVHFSRSEWEVVEI